MLKSSVSPSSFSRSLMKKLDEEKKVTRPRAVVSQWTGARSKVVWISRSSITSKKNTCPALPEEDGVIKIFKSTQQGFRCFEQIYVLKGQRGYTLHNFHKKSENVYYIHD